MSFQLDPSILASITQEARQCFLDEDAPEYLQTLTEGLQKRDRSPDFTALLRAAHSLKGGAGLASLPSLQQLAHKLEDVLQLLEKGNIAQLDLGWELVGKTIDETAFVLSQARTVHQVEVDPNLLNTLISFVEPFSQQRNNHETVNQEDSQGHNFIIQALNEDLEAKLVEIAELSSDLPDEIIQQGLASFYDECLFLGESLDLSWLVEAVSAAQTLTSQATSTDALLVTQEIVSEIRRQREEYLTQIFSQIKPAANKQIKQDINLVITALNEDLETKLIEIEQLEGDLPDEILQQAIGNFYDECLFLAETLDISWLKEKIAPLEEVLPIFPPAQVLLLVQEIIPELRSQRADYLNQFATTQQPKTENISSTVDDTTTPTKAQAQLRIPLQKVENITNNVEELILIEARLNLGQKQLEEAQKRLQQLNRQFEPIQEQVQVFYNQLAIDATGIGINQSSTVNQKIPFNNNIADNSTFDSLELDRYTELHGSLQSFQELMLQIQETRRDIDLINRNFSESLEQVRRNLDGLYNNVTESRLVPFRVLAQRFIPQIQSLNRRYHKSVILEIQGDDTLVDQVLLEQLQTPLTHLLNNAFDHGIESLEERLTNGKPESARISLQAVVKNNQLVISLQDDGRGININKVYQKAVSKGICPPEIGIDQLPPKEIINWIFQPEFSTADQVSDISGRGMGMDIVRSQIRKLRGALDVDTKVNLGTTFTIKLPLNLSLVALLLIKLQNRIVAIPSGSVRETLLFRELKWVDSENSTIIWQKQPVPLVLLPELLPCPKQPLVMGQPKVVIILEAGLGILAIAVDGLIAEEELIVKPFDDTVPIPSYLAGCTILGTGEVIPVILPQGFESSILTNNTPVSIPVKEATEIIPTILVAEDSVATRKLLEKIFTSLGWEVILCRDGQEAVEQFTVHYQKISVVISDVEMPRKNGFELLEFIKKHPKGKQTPVVMATSRTGDRHRQKAQELGASGYLGKPIQPQDLLNTITPFLSHNNI